MALQDFRSAVQLPIREADVGTATLDSRPPSDQDSVELDIVIPVYNEAENIALVLDALLRSVRTPFRVLICYDRDDDNTLPVLDGYRARGVRIVGIKSRAVGPLSAVLSGFEASTAPAVMTMPADDDYNASRIDTMVATLLGGAEIVCASRFMPGGVVHGYPWSKAALVRSAAWVLRHVARLATHDPTNGFRLFSRRVIAEFPIDSAAGHAYSLELLVKVHRLRWPIAEVPVEWFERTRGVSRFRVLRWLPVYLRWFTYALATVCLHRGPDTVRRNRRAVECPG